MKIIDNISIFLSICHLPDSDMNNDQEWSMKLLYYILDISLLFKTRILSYPPSRPVLTKLLNTNQIPQAVGAKSSLQLDQPDWGTAPRAGINRGNRYLFILKRSDNRTDLVIGVISTGFLHRHDHHSP